jgi:hypothetical protein
LGQGLNVFGCINPGFARDVSPISVNRFSADSGEFSRSAIT